MQLSLANSLVQSAVFIKQFENIRNGFLITSFSTFPLPQNHYFFEMSSGKNTHVKFQVKTLKNVDFR